MLLKSLKTHFACAAGIFLISPSLANAAVNDVAAIGLVEQLNCSAGSFKVAGLKFQAANRNLISQFCSLSDGTAFRYVAVVGTNKESGGAVALKISKLDSESYVPGASAVFVRGLVSSVDTRVGEFEVLGSRVIGAAGNLPTAGSFVEVLGTQPSLNGAVVASKIAISGSGKSLTAISGSGLESAAISGSGKALTAISGSGFDNAAISGSGKSLTAISGSGFDNAAISGSGKALTAISGSGFDNAAISGSGKSLTAISGSGFDNAAISGSGKSLTAISGSGKSVTAISGSGLESAAISGSGKSLTAISGSGFDNAAISGSGKSLTAISGSGKSVTAISGSGLESAAISGSGY